MASTVDQAASPAGITDQGTAFISVGMFNIASHTLVVRLSNNATGIVVADAIRIEHIGEIPTGPEIVSVGNGSNIAGDTGELDFSDIEAGSIATRTVTVHNFGTENLVLKNPVSATTGFTATNFEATILAPNTSTTFDLQIDTSVVTTLNRTISFNNNDADESAFRFSVQGNIIPLSTLQEINNGGLGFSTTGAWTQLFTPNGHDSDFQYAVGSPAETATAF